MKFRIINIIFFIFCFNLIFGQTNVLIPNKGIKGISVVIDSTKISDVIKIYGTDYTISENTLSTNYRYDKIGLTFQVDPYDKNQIVRSISVEAPFKAKTENGIVLNECTMKEVLEQYQEKGCFVSNSYAWTPQNGITYYIKKDPKKKAYNTKEKIYKIEINNNGEFGISSRANFEFNDKPIKEKLKSLIVILQSDSFDFKRLESFWNKEKTTENQPYELEKRTVIYRQIENGLTQENIEIIMVGVSYDLNIITYENKLAYIKLIDNTEQHALFERIENPDLEKIDFDVYTFGTYCGHIGIPPNKCERMLELVNANNYDQLASWLKSINPEIATYGYIGLQFLKKKGYEIGKVELERMNKLSESEIELITCKACSFRLMEKMKDLLKDKNINLIYRSFQQNGWIK